MGYTVMIAEKPSVARDYASYLKISDKQDGYIQGFSPVLNCDLKITWAIGHLITLSYPEKYDPNLKKWNLDDLPFLPLNYKYELIKDVSKQFKVIKSLYANADTIYYAGDSGREGLYIQALIRRMATVPEGIEERVVWLNSITEKEVLRGIKEAKPYSDYKLKFASGYARAIEDYASGINFSRALTCKYGQEFNKRASEGEFLTISVGRVMSTTLGMVVAREREIREFKEEKYYKIIATSSFDAEWHLTKESIYYNSPFVYNEIGFKDELHAVNFKETCEKNPVLAVTEVEVKEEKKGAPLLFNLAELQLYCSKKYKLSPDQTLKIAQTLYEAHYITYPRTDSRYLSKAIASEINHNLNGLFNGTYKREIIEEIHKSGSYKRLESSPYVNDERVTDHYAIIPTGKANEIEKLKENERKVLFDIIDRFLSIFYPPCIYEKGEITLQNIAKEEFKGNTKTIKEMGWTKVLSDSEKPSENPFKAFKPGDEVYANYSVKEGKTTPPKRYTSGSMIIAMENAGKLIEDEELRATISSCGIGTSATRAGIIKKLISEKHYLNCNPKTQILTPTYAGECCVDILSQTIPSLLSPEMTASWEKGLLEIEDGSVTYNEFMEKLQNYIRTEVEKIKGTEEITYSGENICSGPLICPFCGGEMKENQKAFSCQNYKDGSCNFSVWKKIAGKTISRQNIYKLVKEGKSNLISGFQKKDKDGTYAAYLVLDREGKKVAFDFPVKKNQSS